MTVIRCSNDVCRYQDPYSGECTREHVNMHGDADYHICESFENEEGEDERTDN